MRTSSVELPSASELRTMMRQESPRLARHQDYLDARPWLFTELKRIAHHAGIDTAVFDHYTVYDFDDTIAKLLHSMRYSRRVTHQGGRMPYWCLARQRIGELLLQWSCIMLVLLPK